MTHPPQKINIYNQVRDSRREINTTAFLLKSHLRNVASQVKKIEQDNIPRRFQAWEVEYLIGMRKALDVQAQRIFQELGRIRRLVNEVVSGSGSFRGDD